MPPLLVLPLLLAAIAYARVLDGPFQFDDARTIESSGAVKSLEGYLRAGFWSDFVGGGRPVTNLTFAANYAVGGLDPWGFHLANVAIHLVVSALVYVFTLELARLAGASRARWLAAFAAGVFAVHPLQSAAVSYISQRSESLASGFYLSALLFLLRAERHWGSWRGVTAWAGAFAAFALGLGAKVVAVTMPAAYLLLAAAVSGTAPARAVLTSWRVRLVLVAPFFVLAGVLAATTLRSVSGSPDAGFAVPGLSPWDYLLTQLRVLVIYLRLLVWPAGQNVDWDLPVSRDVLEPAVLASAAFLVLFAAAAVALFAWGRAREGENGAAARLAALGVGWFFLLLSVTSSVVPLADVLFEHRVYLASWGIIVAMGSLLERAVTRVGDVGAHEVVLGIGTLALGGALAAGLHSRNAVWESNEALWTDALRNSPNKPRVRLSLGFAYRIQERYDEAIAQYVAGLELARGDTAMEVQLLRNLGFAHASAGRIDAAMGAYRAGLEKAPDNPDLLMNMAGLLAALNRPAAAEPLIRRALEMLPDDADAWTTLASVLLGKPDPDGALVAARRATELNPDHGAAHVQMGLASDRLGRAAEACTAWRRARTLHLRPDERLAVQRLLDGRCLR